MQKQKGVKPHQERKWGGEDRRWWHWRSGQRWPKLKDVKSFMLKAWRHFIFQWKKENVWVETIQIFQPDIWVWSAGFTKIQHSGRNNGNFLVIQGPACLSCVVIKEPTLCPSAHMGLSQQYQHVSVNISSQDVEECCSGQFLQKIWARRKVGQELIQSVYPPHAPITTTTASLVQPSEDKPVDIVHLLFWRLDHL